MLKSKHYNARGLFFSERLTAALRKIPDYFLTIVEAPMGYGKTTAVKEYLNQANVEWLWQTVYDQETMHFWHDFCQLVASIDGECACKLEELGMPDDAVTRRAAVQLLEGVKLNHAVVLVIDDYHLLQDENVHEFIVLLARKELPHLHLVLTTRAAALDALDELKLKGIAQHITQGALELTPTEIIRYYKTCGVSLKKEEADRLYLYTEGWISALYLCLLEFLQEGRVEKPATMQDLLARVVYQPLTEELKEFLLCICLFPSLTEAQAQAMWRQDDAAALLRQLLAQNAFTQFNARTRTYQIHTIFVEYLRRLFAAQEETVRREIWRRAGLWYVETEDYRAAMNSFYQAGDFEGLLTALERDKGNSINSEYKDTIIRYFEECPQEIRAQHPVAGVLFCRELLLFGEMERFCQYAQELTEDLNRIEDATKRNWLQGEMELVGMFTKYNDIAAMAEHIKKAHALLPGVSRLSDHNTPWTLGSPSILYMFYREKGRLQQHAQTLLEAMPSYYALTNGHGAGVEHVMQGELHYGQGDFESAEISSHKALELARSGKQIGSIVSVLFLQLRLAFQRGDLQTVQALLEEMYTEIQLSKQSLYLHTADLCGAFVAAQLKQPENITPWIRQGEFFSSRLLFPAQGYFNIIYGQVLLVAGEERKLLGISEQLLETAALFPNLLAQIYLYIYIAAANEKLFRREAARKALTSALDLAIPDGLLMPFVENAVYIERLLDEAVRGSYREKGTEFATLIQHYQKSLLRMQQELGSDAGKPELTQREQEIVVLATEGLTNREIGVELGISENTVKTQLKRIFEKLGIRSRALLIKN